MRRAALCFVALLTVPVALEAQMCVGQAPWSSGNLKAGGSIEFDGGTALAGHLATGKDGGMFFNGGAGVITDGGPFFIHGPWPIYFPSAIFPPVPFPARGPLLSRAGK